MSRLRLPKYVEISREIESRIKNGVLSEGRIPSLRSIAEEHGVSVVTAARALRILGDRGLVRAVERSGCFVAAPKEELPERWALCQRVTAGPWQRVATSLFEQSFQRIAHEQGGAVLTDSVVLSDDMSDREVQRRIRSAVEDGVVGVFFLPSRISDEAMRQDEMFLRACYTAEMPLVLVERNLRGAGRRLEHDLIASDDLQGGLECTQHLLDIGRRRIAFVTGSPCSSHDGRVAGYLSAMNRARASLATDWQPEVLEQSSEPTERQTYRELADVVLQLKADGVVCYEDYTAMGLILELLTREVRIPGDVAVAGFDNLPIGNSFTMGLTTYGLASDEITRRAIDVMRERIQNPGRRPMKIIVPGELIVRESSMVSG
jgi:LacI family transcriptional regulator